MKLDFDPSDNVTWFDRRVAPLVFACVDYTNKLRSFLVLPKIMKNFLDFLLFKLGMSRHLTLRFADGRSVSVSSRRELTEFWKSSAGWSELHSLDAARLRAAPRSYFDFWREPRKGMNLEKLYFWLLDMRKTYDWLGVGGRTVVDVGAFVGDSAISFVLRGAKHVYSFELYPYSYAEARRNVGAFGLNDRISLFNEGAAGRPGAVRVSERFKNTVGSGLETFSKGKRVGLTTLDEIVKRFRIRHAVMKVDCEGSEYPFLLNASDDALKRFDQIMIEYHHGYRNLVDRLRRAGFSVRHDAPRYFHTTDSPDIYIGNIYAER